jgi:glycosyltransferase involved in cell wall biosynthesis
MLDLPAFLALTRWPAEKPVLLYFHENQFTYPRLRETKLNSWFGQINYLSACVADQVAFNSAYHRDDFLGALRTLAGQPNNWLLAEAIDEIEAKSAVLPVGVELDWLDGARAPREVEPPLVLWNARWEFDKAPEVFVRAVTALAREGVDFRVALAGDPGVNPNLALLELQETMGERLLHAGYLDTAEYGQLLWRSSVVVSTARHEFFGVGMVEAMFCGCVPVAPKRYNYPALMPEELHGRCLWEDEAGLRDRMRALITCGAGEDVRERVQREAAKYGWGQVGPLWDEAFNALAQAETRGGMRDRIRGGRSVSIPEP